MTEQAERLQLSEAVNALKSDDDFDAPVPEENLELSTTSGES